VHAPRPLLAALFFIGCTAAAEAPRVRAPLGAYLGPTAATGEPVPLRVDPNAKVSAPVAAGLPPASYALEQAERGRRIYLGTCTACHPPAQFTGESFAASWSDRRVSDLFALVRSTMPLDDPGGLPEQDYLDVIAYLLQVNGAPAGAAPLAADADTLRGQRIALPAP